MQHLSSFHPGPSAGSRTLPVAQQVPRPPLRDEQTEDRKRRTSCGRDKDWDVRQRSARDGEDPHQGSSHRLRAETHRGHRWPQVIDISVVGDWHLVCGLLSLRMTSFCIVASQKAKVWPIWLLASCWRWCWVIIAYCSKSIGETLVGHSSIAESVQDVDCREVAKLPHHKQVGGSRDHSWYKYYRTGSLKYFPHQGASERRGS